jgi:ABC-type sugar transport system ATPase subunit
LEVAGVYTASGLRKRYGGVQALAGVDFEIHPGEVQGLVGANGAGKSTLVKILVGAEQPSQGRLVLDGEPVRFGDVGDGIDHGVAIVSQELNLFPDLSVLDNLFLLREPRRAGLFVDRAEMRRRAQPVVDAVGLAVPLDRPVGDLRLGERQLVEIARALLDEPNIVFLDEPTSALRRSESDRLHGVVRGLRDRGVGVVYVSHILEDVFAICDTVSILRNGRVVTSRAPRAELTIPQTVERMLGQAAPALLAEGAGPARPTATGAPALRVSGVTVDGMLEPLDLEARQGEIVGLAGLDGSGVQAVFDVVFGRRSADAGTVTLPNRRGAPRSVTHSVRSGVAFVPSDRKRLGVMLDKPIFENVTTVRAGVLRRMGIVLRKARMVERARHWAERLGIKMTSADTPVGALSGGNQQKVMLAKWLEADPSVVMLDDPTRGVDVGAKVEIHSIIADIAARGKVVIVASSDLEELCTLCDRVVVLFKGRACGELPRGELTEHRLLEAINTGRVAATAASATNGGLK